MVRTLPGKDRQPLHNRQLLDKYRILPGISPAEQYGQVEKAFRELDARLVRMTERQSYADDLFESLRRKSSKPEKYAQEIVPVQKESTEPQAPGRRIKTLMPVFGRTVLSKHYQRT